MLLFYILRKRKYTLFEDVTIYQMALDSPQVRDSDILLLMFVAN